MAKAYLTIDDSPSSRMDDLTDFLAEKNIPAIFFCRGDLLEQNPEAALRAIQKGFVLANHTYSHKRSSEEDLDWFTADIERCEKLIENIYKQANTAQPGKYFRFPHVDRGTGGWVVDYDSYEGMEKEAVLRAFAEGLNVKTLMPPTAAAIEKKQRLQAYLKSAGYTQPFLNVAQDWFCSGEIAAAHDCLYTYSNCDWMVTARHLGKWPYKSVQDLKEKAVADPFLLKNGETGVILAHDQAEIVDVTMELVEDLAHRGIQFLESV